MTTKTICPAENSSCSAYAGGKHKYMEKRRGVRGEGSPFPVQTDKVASAPPPSVGASGSAGALNVTDDVLVPIIKPPFYYFGETQMQIQGRLFPHVTPIRFGERFSLVLKTSLSKGHWKRSRYGFMRLHNLRSVCFIMPLQMSGARLWCALKCPGYTRLPRLWCRPALETEINVKTYWCNDGAMKEHSGRSVGASAPP